jgi:3-hydroxypropanoate dehydrogenase
MLKHKVEHSMAKGVLTDEAQDLIFRDAHTARGWQGEKVSPELLEKIYDLMKFGPTSANCSPLRVVFVQSPEAKEKLKPCLDPGNVAQTMAAPATAIFAYDMKFYDHLSKLYPQTDARSWFAGNDAKIFDTAFRNGTLQAGYFMIAARGLGLDCGPMSGFDNKKLDAAFFADGRYKSNFLCNLGYADPARIYPRNPRLGFGEACQIQ